MHSVSGIRFGKGKSYKSNHHKSIPILHVRDTPLELLDDHVRARADFGAKDMRKESLTNLRTEHNTTEGGGEVECGAAEAGGGQASLGAACRTRSNRSQDKGTAITPRQG